MAAPATGSLDSTIETLAALERDVAAFRTVMERFATIDYQTLAPRDKVRLNTTMAYAFATLEFTLLRLENTSLKRHPIMEEMDRIRAALRPAGRN